MTLCVQVLLAFTIQTVMLFHKRVRFVIWVSIYRVSQKRGHRLMTIILSVHNRFKIFFHEKIPCKLALKWILKISPHLAYVSKLPCEILMSAKQSINDKLQGSVATYLRCGGVVNNQIKNGLFLSL